ncbi:hypothetical protein E1301_Tti022663 [Triplophysa tibetana]|uniref:Uncharacterized protein n=1 Tax=Triplophysa tibetana TaxID=1572043 RepID=A0A5A9N879_9TELE|nr:hypothetical protein E1301_Tti022663 [Triplophysa tibetana]
MTVISVLLVLVCLLFIIQLAKRVEKLLPVAACFFVLPSTQLGLLLYHLVGYWTGTPVNTTSQQGSQNSVEFDGTHTTKLPILDQNQTGESHEIKTLSKDPGNSVERDEIT